MSSRSPRNAPSRQVRSEVVVSAPQGGRARWASLPGRAKVALVASAALVVAMVAAGLVAGVAAPALAVGAGVVGGVAVSVSLRRRSGIEAAQVVAVLAAVVAVVLAWRIDGAWWAAPTALVAGGSAFVSVVVSRYFAPAKHRLAADTRAKVAALAQYQVIDVPVPGGAEVLVAADGRMYLLGVAAGEDPTTSAGYVEFVERRRRLETVLARSGVDAGAIALVEDREKFGPVTTDDGVVVCSLSQLRRATGESRQSRRRR